MAKGETLVEEIRLQVKAPGIQGSGLTRTMQQLETIDRLLMGINSKLSGVVESPVLVRSARQIRQELDKVFSGRNVSRNPKELAKSLGLDADAFGRFILDQEKQILSKVNAGRKGSKIGRVLNTGGDFTQRNVADQALAQFSKAQNSLQQQLRNSISQFFSSAPGSVPVGKVDTAGVTGEVAMRVPGGQVRAKLDGTVVLRVPAGQVSAVGGVGATGAAASSGVAGGGGGGGKKGLKKLGPAAPEPARTERELRRVRTRTSGTAQVQVEKALSDLTRRITTFGSEGGEVAEREIDDLQRRTREQFKQRIQAIRSELQSGIDERFTGVKSKDQGVKANLFSRAAGQLKLSPDEEALLRQSQLGGLAGQFERTRGGFQARAARASTEAAKAREVEAAKALAQSQRDAAQAQRESARAYKQNAKSAKGLQKAQAEAAKSVEGYGRFWEQTLSRQAGSQRLAGLQREGFSQVGADRLTFADDRLKSRTRVFQRQQGDEVQQLVATEKLDKAGRILETRFQQTAKTINEVSKAAASANRNFVQNTLHVTAWAASVGVLYGAINIARHALTSLVDTGFQTARLGQVFRGVGGSAQQLTDDVLTLASANGRSADEALEAAIAWSRQGLTRQQVNEAVRVSLVAANVAEISAAEATERLAAVMAAYNLEVSELSSVLGQLNAISNTTRVTNKELLDGLARSAAVARQAGLSFSELVGILGATVEKTGQSGANIGNAVKSITTAFGRPDLRKFLQEKFEIDVRSDTSGIKNLSEILQELFLRYQELNNQQRLDLLYKVAGRTQSSRLAAILDAYIVSQVKAVQAQLNLNSAEEENIRIKATLRSQLQSVITEFERFVNLQGNRTLVPAVRDIAKAFQNLLSLLNSGGINQALTGVLFIMTAVGAQLALTSVQMAATGKSAGFMANTIARLGSAWTSLQVAMNSVITGSGGRVAGTFKAWADSAQLASRKNFAVAATVDQLILKQDGYTRATRLSARATVLYTRAVGAAQAVLAFASRAMGVFTVALTSVLPWLAAGYLAMLAWNAGAEALGFSSEAAERRLVTLGNEVNAVESKTSAAADAMRLFDTAIRAIGSTRTTQDLADIVEEVGKISDRPGGPARFRKLAESGPSGQQELRRELEGERQRSLARFKVGQQQKFEFEQRAIEVADREIARLTRLNTKLPFGDASRNDKIQEFEASRAASVQRAQRAVGAQIEASTDASQDFLRSDQQHLTVMQTMRSTLEGIADVYRQLPATTPTARLNQNISVLQAQEQVITRSLDRVREDERLLTQSNVETDLQKSESLRIEKELRGQLRGVNERQSFLEAVEDSTPSARGGRVVAELNQLSQQRAQLEREISEQETLRSGLDPGDAASVLRLRGQRQELESLGKDTRAKIDALSDPNVRSLADKSTRLNTFEQLERAGTARFEVGESPVEQLLSKQAAFQESLNRLRAQAVSSDQESVRLYVHQTELLATQLELKRKSFELDRDAANLARRLEQERQRSLLTGTPNDLLRQFAAQQINTQIGAPGGGGAGQFFALSADLRQTLEQFFPKFNQDFQRLGRDRNRVANQPDNNALADAAVQLSTTVEAYAKLNDGVQAQLRLVRLGNEAMGTLATSARGAAEALSTIPAVVQQLVAQELGGGRGSLANPDNPI